jgi:LysM repeat protein
VNTLKSATTIVVLLGVLYGVYIVLSNPDRLREIRAPGSAAPQADAGPQIDFSPPLSPAPEVAVETGAGMSARLETTSPASLASPPASVPGPPSAYGPSHGANQEASAAASTSSAPPASSYASGSAYGSSASNYGSSNSGASSTSASTYGAAGSSANERPEQPAYSGSYSSSTYGTGTSSEPSTYGQGSGAAVQPAYGTSTDGAGAIAAASLSDASPHVTSDALTEYSIRQMWAQAEQLVAQNRFKQALELLSTHYSHPSLPGDHRAAMLPWLDALAARVIYSRQHLLELPYEVRAKDTLFDLQARFKVPYQLLQSINQEVVSDPQVLVVGTQLKVMQGPFRAEVDLARSEITVFLDKLYAGRFPFVVGNEPPQLGQYSVADKRTDRTYYGADGTTIPASDPSNPYGGYWIALNRGELCIHGSPTRPATAHTLGCISLSPQDAKDLYGILSNSSEVVIR